GFWGCGGVSIHRNWIQRGFLKTPVILGVQPCIILFWKIPRFRRSQSFFQPHLTRSGFTIVFTRFGGNFLPLFFWATPVFQRLLWGYFRGFLTPVFVSFQVFFLFVAVFSVCLTNKT
uniref:Uncharacterized protein n=1 Tax=Ciona intestinalis TaxID=7719 RepID=H2XMG5_CIOIN